MWTTNSNYNQLNLAPKGVVCLVTGRPTSGSPHSLRAFLYEQAEKAQSSQFCIDKKGFTKRPKMEKTIQFIKNSLYLYEREIQQRNLKQNHSFLQ